MKVSAAALALSASAWAAVVPQQQALLANHPTQNIIHHEPEKFLIELGPYQTRWVTEEEKWALKLVCLRTRVTHWLEHMAIECRSWKTMGRY